MTVEELYEELGDLKAVHKPVRVFTTDGPQDIKDIQLLQGVVYINLVTKEDKDPYEGK